MPPPKWPVIPKPGPPFRAQPAFSTGPVITSVSPNSSVIGGGVTITITGIRLRNNVDGTAPTVLFGAIPGTGVVVVDPTTITVTAPAASGSGLVDVSVTIDGQTSTLDDAFAYYQATITELIPRFGPAAGGTATVLYGFNFLTGSTITFGGVAGIDATFIDEEHYAVTTPAHAGGHVNVVITPPAGTPATLSNGFQYTTLARGQDVRRNPGINIHDNLNNAPNDCTFTIDGNSNAPSVGEPVTIVDSFDGNRLLFSGKILDWTQRYEGKSYQIAWTAHAVDHTWMLKKRWPFGSYDLVPADAIVRDLITKYAPEFTNDFVQTNLAPLTIKFDGTQDLPTALSTIATNIGGGHWYVDYLWRMHFFHTPPPDLKPLVPISAGPGTPIFLSEGSSMPSLLTFDAAYYYVRSTFIYSNGVESRMGPVSNIVAFTGTKQMRMDNIPIGTDPSGTITCVARRIYLQKGIGQLKRFIKVTDNTTTTIEAYIGMSSSGVIQYEYKIPGTKGTSTAPSNTAVPPPPLSGPTVSLSGSGASLVIPPTQQGFYVFRVAALYPDGTESSPSPESERLGIGGATATTVYFSNLPTFTDITGTAPTGYVVYVRLAQATNVGPGGSVPSRGTPLSPRLGILPYGPSSGSAPSKPDFGERPKPGGTGPEFVWPNPDGPYLEDTNQPDDLTDTNDLLMHDPPFDVSEDVSQLRNRVIVLGAGTTVTDDVAQGESEIPVSDISIFSDFGGTVLLDGGQVVDYLAPSTHTTGIGTIFLTTELEKPVVNGAAIRFYFMVEDVDAQNERGAIELDKSGNPTDGVHEFVVSDTSLKFPQQLYMRGNAELEVFGRPIKTITYVTRDPKTRSGAIVHADMKAPPCVGDFLIQQVDIDQVHDQNDDLDPRYHVTASSSRYDLNDFLLQLATKLTEGKATGDLTGVPKSAVNTINAAAGTFVYAEYTFTSAQIRSLNSSPVEVLSAPGEGKVIVPIWAVEYTHEVNLYSQTTGLSLYYSVDENGGGGPGNNAVVLFSASSFTAGGVAEQRWNYALNSATFFDRNIPAGGGGSPVNKSIYARSSANVSGDSAVGQNINYARLVIAYVVIDDPAVKPV